MTDQTIPADKIREMIEGLTDSLDASSGSESDIGFDRATRACIHDLNQLLPKPPTLADELREYAGNSLAGVLVSDVKRQLDSFADRVETLEQERDEARKDCEYLAEERDMAVTEWGIAAGALKVEAEVTSEAIDRHEALAKELSEARVLVEEQATEITRLRAREIPAGWRIADHPEKGAVLVAESPDEEGDVHYVWLGTSLRDHINRGWGSPDRLSFRDEEADQ